MDWNLKSQRILALAIWLVLTVQPFFMWHYIGWASLIICPFSVYYFVKGILNFSKPEGEKPREPEKSGKPEGEKKEGENSEGAEGAGNSEGGENPGESGESAEGENSGEGNKGDSEGSDSGGQKDESSGESDSGEKGS